MSPGAGRDGDGPGDVPLVRRLRTLLGTLTALLEVRLALLGSELGEAAQRAVRGLWFGVAAAVLAGHAVLLVVAAVVLALPEAVRPLALGALGALGFAVAFGLLRAAARLLKPGPDGPLPLTRAELRQDASVLGGAAPAPMHPDDAPNVAREATRDAPRDPRDNTSAAP